MNTPAAPRRSPWTTRFSMWSTSPSSTRCWKTTRDCSIITWNLSTNVSGRPRHSSGSSNAATGEMACQWSRPSCCPSSNSPIRRANPGMKAMRDCPRSRFSSNRVIPRMIRRSGSPQTPFRFGSGGRVTRNEFLRTRFSSTIVSPFTCRGVTAAWRCGNAMSC